MTREEEILNKAIDYSEIEENFLEYDDCGDVCDDKEFIEQAFIEGVKWADENPQFSKEELINKACEWIQHNKAFYKILAFGSIHTDWDKFIKEFRKAMLEDE